MPVDISLWRARIGSFLRYYSLVKSNSSHRSFSVLHIFGLSLLLTLAWPLVISALLVTLVLLILYKKNVFLMNFSKIIYSKNFRTLCKIMILFSDLLALNQLFIAVILKMLLLSSGCIESNPGPDNKITFGVWNLDSLLTRDKHKIGLIEGINSVKKFDIFGVVESYLTPDINEDELEIHGFSPIPFRADSSSVGRPRGGVCLYYNIDLPIINRTNMTDIEETIVTEIRLKKKKIFFILSYHSPAKNSASKEETYCKKMQVLFDNIN